MTTQPPSDDPWQRPGAGASGPGGGSNPSDPPLPSGAVVPVPDGGAPVLTVAADGPLPSAHGGPISAPPIAPGPGVIPPFVTPPREGHKRRLGIGIAISAVIAVVCCGGGSVGMGALLVASGHQRERDARAVVTTYLNDWQREDYPGAYTLLCNERRNSVSLDDFTRSLSSDQVTGYRLGEVRPAGTAIGVPVDIDFLSGDDQQVTYDVVLDSDGKSRICGAT